MDILWQVIKCILGCCVMKIFLTSIITQAAPVPTNLPDNQIQPTDLEVITSCGNVCEYEEWFSRAHCDDRGLTYVPSSTGCEGATLLDLQDNSIKSIPPERIAEYNHVKTLDISWNQISVLEPGTFLGLNSLKNIICSHNGIEVVPDGVFNGAEESLTNINLNNNNIYILGARAFNNLIHVIVIYLNNNNIQSLPQKIFIDLTNVKSLVLSDNDLNYVEKDHFKGLIKLEYLSLDGNNLKEIPEGLFADLESLKEVLLSHNQLITIPAPQNLGLHFGLERLDLRNNHLNQSAAIIPYIMNTTWSVHLHNNPFVCDCYFQSIQTWLNTTMNSEKIIFTTQENPLRCTFTDDTTYSISGHLPIICSDTNKENTTVANYTTVPTATSHGGNDRLVTSLNPNNNVSFTELQNDKTVVLYQERQGTKVVSSSNGLNIANFIVLVIFLALWIVKSVWYRYAPHHDLRRHKSKKRECTSPKTVSNGECKSNGCEKDDKETQPLNSH